MTKRSKSKKKKDRQKFTFPKQPRCPRCNYAQTRAVSTQGQNQYRRCLNAICRKRFTVIGSPVEPDPKSGKSSGSSSSSSSSSSKG